MNVINNHLNTSETPALPPDSDNTNMVGLIAFIITIFPAPITYSDLAKAIVTQLPYGYFPTDILEDAYSENSLKNSERAMRGVFLQVLQTFR